ncbi:MAG TPA: carbohydrate porin [Candidatus Sulfotelmatobacter sp.]|jgi:porin
MRSCLPAFAILGAAILWAINNPAVADEGLFEREKATGNWGGARSRLQEAGIDFEMSDIAEVLRNATGGKRQLTIYQGLLKPSLNLDLEKLANWPGASFYVDGLQISGRGLSRNAIGNLLAVSNIEALPSTRLHDLWLQQGFLDRQASLRVGQIALDDEFYISQYSANFVNSTFGCPDILSTDLPSGGPCYPFATPGARLRVAATTGLTFSAVVFNGNPAPPGPGDPQVRNSSGTNFLISEGGFLTMAELAYWFDTEPSSPEPMSDIKLGGWYHTADFPDLRRDTLGRSLAEPSSNGIAGTHQGDFGIYMVVDKLVWQPLDTATQGLAAFLRIGCTPPDRNLLSLEVDAGITYTGLFPGRELDMLGVAGSYGRLGNAARLDRDAVLFTGVERPIRDYEAVLEITYKGRIAPWWVLQPDLQLVFHPGGHIAAPSPAPMGRSIPNALVLGLRSTITF